MAAGADPGQMSRQAVGRYGEGVAVRFLTDKGLTILDRNWHCREGEIDIVAFDPVERCLVVVEVKTRRSQRYGSPLEAVTERKAARLRVLAACWLREHSVSVGQVRIDVIGIVRPRTGPAEVTHVRDVTP